MTVPSFASIFCTQGHLMFILQAVARTDLVLFWPKCIFYFALCGPFFTLYVCVHSEFPWKSIIIVMMMPFGEMQMDSNFNLFLCCAYSQGSCTTEQLDVDPEFCGTTQGVGSSNLKGFCCCSNPGVKMQKLFCGVIIQGSVLGCEGLWLSWN